MKVNLKSRNGSNTKPTPWEDDDLEDKFAAKLADSHSPETAPEPIQPSPSVSDVSRSPSRSDRIHTTKHVNAKELIEVLVSAYMASDEDRVTIEVRGSDILVQQVLTDTSGQRTKTSWTIGISKFEVVSRKLIK